MVNRSTINKDYRINKSLRIYRSRKKWSKRQFRFQQHWFTYFANLFVQFFFVTFRNVPMKVRHISGNEKWTNQERERGKYLEEENVDLSSFSFSLKKKITEKTLFDTIQFSCFINFHRWTTWKMKTFQLFLMFFIVNPNLLIIQQISGK